MKIALLKAAVWRGRPSIPERDRGRTPAGVPSDLISDPLLWYLQVVLYQHVTSIKLAFVSPIQPISTAAWGQSISVQNLQVRKRQHIALSY